MSHRRTRPSRAKEGSDRIIPEPETRIGGKRDNISAASVEDDTVIG
jgi:hypothetical protein